MADVRASQNLKKWLMASDGLETLRESANKKHRGVHLACLLDHSEILQLLIDHLCMMDRQTADAELNRPTDNTQRTPAFFAAKAGNARCPSELIDLPEHRPQPSTRGDTPVHVARDEGKAGA